MLTSHRSEDDARPAGSPASPGGTSDVTVLLERHREAVLAFLRREGAGLRRYESEEDLFQGLHLHLLEMRYRFEYRNHAATLAWLQVVARHFLAKRFEHWKASCRRCTGVLRLPAAGPTPTGPVPCVVPSAAGPGPVTQAQNREDFAHALGALASLSERDRRIVALVAGGASIAEIAAALCISLAAASKARGRALDRYQRACEALLDPRA
jgi:DNA-directed RNA polymerase specialized sigma24 family protein